MPAPDPIGSYRGTSTPVPSTSSVNPNDIWGLGDLYGKPIYQGYATAPTVSENGQDLIPGKTRVVNHFGQTQDLVKQVIALWSQQEAERQKNPNQLTQYEQLQQALWAGGFYGQTSYAGIHAGQWTGQTQAALHAALQSYEQATGNGTSPTTFTEFLLQNQAPTGGPNGPDATSGGSTPAQVAVTDPNEIRAAAQSAAQSALGHGLSASQLQKFVDEFQSQQVSAGRSTSSTVTAPELTSEAGAFAQQQDPGDYQTQQHQAFLNALVNMFLPSESARPNIVPVPYIGGSPQPKASEMPYHPDTAPPAHNVPVDSRG